MIVIENKNYPGIEQIGMLVKIQEETTEVRIILRKVAIFKFTFYL